jgi:putative flippase GtrA
MSTPRGGGESPRTLKQYLQLWCAFNLVGILGFILQLVCLTILRGVAGLHYLIATGLSVEAAVLHNFVWHERWTWADRANALPEGVGIRLLKFNLSNGAISLCGNILLMRLFVGTLGLHYLVANVSAILLCAVFNFILSDRLVFRRP